MSQWDDLRRKLGKADDNGGGAAYAAAQDAYDRFGVDTERALALALAAPLSLHCWQADDVQGFEARPGAADSGGLVATGNYPGRARNGEEARQDLDQVLKLVPGGHRVNVHAMYAETGGQPVERDVLEPAHFGAWMAWARERGIGLDFNPTYFAHPMAADGMTLSHRDPAVRSYWIRHGVACRRIAEAMARETGSPCVLNHWIPDGAKDAPADRWGPRRRAIESLDRMLDDAQGIDTSLCIDSVESKLFGIGSEEYVVGSFEFYSSYALARGKVPCLDMGHFHPTETIHDKLSALLSFHDKLLLHLSRPVRWDSDHVVLFNDDLRCVFLELVRGDALNRVYLALDYFDASINRVAAYVVGARATRKALLYALLDPTALLQDLERKGRGALKLAVMEECKTLPFEAVWGELCRRAGVPAGAGWLPLVESYEHAVQRQRT